MRLVALVALAGILTTAANANADQDKNIRLRWKLKKGDSFTVSFSGRIEMRPKEDKETSLTYSGTAQMSVDAGTRSFANGTITLKKLSVRGKYRGHSVNFNYVPPTSGPKSRSAGDPQGGPDRGKRTSKGEMGDLKKATAGTLKPLEKGAANLERDSWNFSVSSGYKMSVAAGQLRRHGAAYLALEAAFHDAWTGVTGDVVKPGSSWDTVLQIPAPGKEGQLDWVTARTTAKSNDSTEKALGHDCVIFSQEASLDRNGTLESTRKTSFAYVVGACAIFEESYNVTITRGRRNQLEGTLKGHRSLKISR